MGSAQGFSGLELDHHLPFHHEIQTVAADFPSIVVNNDFSFYRGCETLLTKLYEQCASIHTLQEPGPERLMHLKTQ